MDPNPKSFPLLSFVLSRLHPPQPSHADPFDIEQPPAPADELELMERRPDLRHPSLVASMASAIADVAQTRTVLHTLGARPDHEAVDDARIKIAAIDADLSRRLEEIVRAPRPEAVDRREWRAEQAEKEKECRAKAEKEKVAYRAVIQLDEMHDAYERLLREAEERLERIYEAGGSGEGGTAVEGNSEEEKVNEEVIGILQEASGRCVERVDLSGKQLRFLPEAFGRLRGLVSLDVTNNQLEFIPDAIAGLEQLEELRLSSNLLTSLPDSIGLLLNLKILDVSSNQLKLLPDSISNCRSLVELDASYNSLTYLPTNIGHGLQYLQKLWVHLNKLRSLPTSVCEMSSLRLLDAHFNELRGLPYAIGKLTNLESLNLSSNFSDMQELPPSFGDLINLRELDLSNNQIHALPDSFGRLDKLAKLNLDQNPLTVPPMEIVNQGVEAVKEFMSKRWLDILLEEERRSQIQEEPEPSKTGWLTRSTSLLSAWASGVSGYLGGGDKSPRDPYLDQQL